MSVKNSPVLLALYQDIRNSNSEAVPQNIEEINVLVDKTYRSVSSDTALSLLNVKMDTISEFNMETIRTRSQRNVEINGAPSLIFEIENDQQNRERQENAPS